MSSPLKSKPVMNQPLGADCGKDSEAAGDRLHLGLRRSGRGSPLGEAALWHEPVLAALQTFKRIVRLDEVQQHLAVALRATDPTPREPSSHHRCSKLGGGQGRETPWS